MYDYIIVIFLQAKMTTLQYLIWSLPFDQLLQQNLAVETFKLQMRKFSKATRVSLSSWAALMAPFWLLPTQLMLPYSMMTVSFFTSCSGYYLLILGIFFSDVIVRFVEAEYSINENGNAQEVCAELTGRSQISVSISLVTIDGSALSKLLLIL